MGKALGAAGLALAMTVMLANPAQAASSWGSEDDCNGGAPTLYFYREGQATNWGSWYGSGAYNSGCATLLSYSTTGNWTHRAYWYMPVSSNYNGYYAIDTWLPNFYAGGTYLGATYAKYYVWVNGTGGGPTGYQVRDQRTSVAKGIRLWNSVYLYGSNGAKVSLDNHVQANGGQVMTFDYLAFNAL